MTGQTCWYWLWHDMMCQDAFMCDAVWCSVMIFFLALSEDVFWGGGLGGGG